MLHGPLIFIFSALGAIVGHRDISSWAKKKTAQKTTEKSVAKLLDNESNNCLTRANDTHVCIHSFMRKCEYVRPLLGSDSYDSLLGRSGYEYDSL